MLLKIQTDVLLHWISYFKAWKVGATFFGSFGMSSFSFTLSGNLSSGNILLYMEPCEISLASLNATLTQTIALFGEHKRIYQIISMWLKWKQSSPIHCSSNFGFHKLSLAGLCVEANRADCTLVLFIFRIYFDRSLKQSKLSTFYNTGTGFDIATLTLVALDKHLIWIS